jgi:hypothetical protein
MLCLASVLQNGLVPLTLQQLKSSQAVSHVGWSEVENVLPLDGLVGSRAGLEDTEKSKFSSPSGLKL